MRWIELEPDVRPGELSSMSAGLDCRSIVNLVQNWVLGIRIYITDDCLNGVLEHVHSARKEVGGLLIGGVYANHRTPDSIIVLNQALESFDYRNSAVSLRMETEIWDRAAPALRDGWLVVGWYHSHPNLGAFFSSIDRATQQAFFNHSHSIGWVLDPYRDEQKVFLGPNSSEYPHSMVVLDHGLALA